MAEAAAARREARRKRILENSQNRLQLISGKCSSEEFSVTPKESTKVSPIPLCNENAFTPVPSAGNISDYTIPNGNLGASIDSLEPLLSRHDVALGDSEEGPTFADLVNTSPTAATEHVHVPLWKSLIINKYDIVLLSLFLQALHGLFTFPIENSYFFVPLIIYSTTKSLWLPKQNNSSIANIIMLLNGMSSNGIHKMLNFLQWAGTFSQDGCIFLFTTICIQALYSTVIENFVT